MLLIHTVVWFILTGAIQESGDQLLRGPAGPVGRPDLGLLRLWSPVEPSGSLDCAGYGFHSSISCTIKQILKRRTPLAVLSQNKPHLALLLLLPAGQSPQEPQAQPRWAEGLVRGYNIHHALYSLSPTASQSFPARDYPGSLSPGFSIELDRTLPATLKSYREKDWSESALPWQRVGWADGARTQNENQ